MVVGRITSALRACPSVVAARESNLCRSFSSPHGQNSALRIRLSFNEVMVVGEAITQRCALAALRVVA